MVKFSKSEMNTTAKVLRKNLKQGKGYVSKVTMTDTDGKKHSLSKKQYMGLFESQNIYRVKHNKHPAYVTLNSTANNPLVLNYQDDMYSCCVASFNMCVQMLFGWLNESRIKKAFKTSVNGTSPANMIAGAKTLGYNVVRIKRNFDAVEDSLKKGFPVLIHYQTGGSTKPACMGFENDYGHYMMAYAAKDGSFWLADPTKGLKKCSASQINKATNGRDIGYYSVKLA